MLENENFHTKSSFFKDIPWRTDIVFAPGGLDKLGSVPEVSVSSLPFRLMLNLRIFCQGIFGYDSSAGKVITIRAYLFSRNGQSESLSNVLYHWRSSWRPSCYRAFEI